MNTDSVLSSFSSEKIEKPPKVLTSATTRVFCSHLLTTRMAKELSIIQDFRKLTLALPADMVTISVEVKSLKGHYTYSQNNNYMDLSFNPWSEDFQPSETFMRIVRET